MVTTETTSLSGMAEIAAYVRRSEKTVLEWVYTMDFPARKIGGIWESDKDLIAVWRRARICGQPLMSRPEMDVSVPSPEPIKKRRSGKAR